MKTNTFFNCSIAFDCNYKMSLSCFLEEIDPISPNSYFIFGSHLAKFPFHVFGSTWIPCPRFSFTWNYQISDWCFLGDIDPIFKIFNFSIHVFLERLGPYSRYSNILNGFPSCFGPVFSNISNNFEFQVFENSRNSIINNEVCSWIIWSNFVYPKLKIIGFGCHGHVHLVRKQWTWKVLAFPQSEIVNLLIQNEAK